MRKHILSASEFDLAFLIHLSRKLDTVLELMKTQQGKLLLREVLKGTPVGLIFWPSSSRTRNQFLSAVSRLGGAWGSEQGIRKEQPDGTVAWDLAFSSEMKGELYEDTIRAFASAYDVLVIRHFEEGMVAKAAGILDEFSYLTRVINAGDGCGEHPTQALIDFFAILSFLGYLLEKDAEKLKSLRVAMIGDCYAGRTIHSLARLLGPFGVKIYFVSHPELSLPEKYRREFREAGFKCEYSADLVQADIWYVTRTSVDDYTWSKKAKIREWGERYVITQEVVRQFQPQAIFHPLPRLSEMPIWLPEEPATHDTSIDRMPEAQYFNQMNLGVPVRMALLWQLLEPGLEVRDFERRHWVESFTKQCVCGKVFSTILGWSERPQPYSRFLPKVLECSVCRESSHDR